jgi:hypothetical protein
MAWLWLWLWRIWCPSWLEADTPSLLAAGAAALRLALCTELASCCGRGSQGCPAPTGACPVDRTFTLFRVMVCVRCRRYCADMCGRGCSIWYKQPLGGSTTVETCSWDGV